MVSASLLLIKDTKKRFLDLKKGISSIKFAPISFGILAIYVVFVFQYADAIPILNWSWLGYNIAIGPFAEQGMWGILPFIPLLFHFFCTCLFISTMLKNSTLEKPKKWLLYGP